MTYERIVLRFIARIRVAENGCYEWTGGKCEGGYGRVMVRGKTYLAHRLAIILFKHPDLPDYIVVHHICGNTSCVNPSHLECMTKEEHYKLHLAERRGQDAFRLQRAG